ncbi:hypothetical protein BDR26DRAFT_849758 [Obelidium mucronatum]|nr:hypothetical protein BDR26DRAFT_849758 [Obelidium mucronatum]
MASDKSLKKRKRSDEASEAILDKETVIKEKKKKDKKMKKSKDVVEVEQVEAVKEPLETDKKKKKKKKKKEEKEEEEAPVEETVEENKKEKKKKIKKEATPEVVAAEPEKEKKKEKKDKKKDKLAKKETEEDGDEKETGKSPNEAEATAIPEPPKKKPWNDWSKAEFDGDDEMKAKFMKFMGLGKKKEAGGVESTTAAAAPVNQKSTLNTSYLSKMKSDLESQYETARARQFGNGWSSKQGMGKRAGLG